MVGEVLADGLATEVVGIHEHSVLLVASYESAPNVAIVVINQAVLLRVRLHRR